MTVDKFDPVFAIAGGVDSDAKYLEYAAKGMVDELLRYPAYNKAIQLGQLATNSILRNGIRTTTDADAGEASLIKNFHGAPFGKSRDDANQFDVSSDTVYDMQYCNHATRGRILVLPSESSIKAFDIEAEADLGIIITQAQLVAGFTGITNPYAISACCDAEYIYVLCRQNTTATPQVQAFSIADGSVHPDWPAGGVALSAYAQTYSDFEARIRWVADDKLGISQPWVSVTSGTAHGVRIIDHSDGTVLGGGAGDYPNSAGRCVGICGNGNHAFFVIQETGQAFICSMSLTSYGSTGCGAADWPVYSANWDNNEFGGIMCAGHTVVVTWVDSTAEILTVLDDERGLIVNLLSSDTNMVATLGVIAFTGLAWWALGTGDCGQALFQLNAVDRYTNASPTYTTSADRHVTRFGDYRARNYDITNVRMSPLVYDGRDLWYLFVDSADASYYLRRLPRVNVR